MGRKTGWGGCAQVVGVVMATTLASGCTPEGMTIENDTDQRLQILLTADSNVLVADLLPHDRRNVRIEHGDAGCTPDAGFSAYPAKGPDEITRSPAIATLGRACLGDTWTIR